MSLCKFQAFLNNLNVVGQDSAVLGSVHTRTALKSSETKKYKNLSLQLHSHGTALKDHDNQQNTQCSQRKNEYKTSQ